MPYTVSYAAPPINRHQYDAYVRLLARRGIDWTNIPRVSEPTGGAQWLYVWTDRKEAESFCQELRRETEDDRWDVKELSPATPISPGPLLPVVIYVTRQSLGSTFTLHPHSRSAILRRFPRARQVSSIFIEHGKQFDFENQQGPIWEHIASVLTGLSSEQLADLGGYRIVSPADEQTVFESAAALAT